MISNIFIFVITVAIFGLVPGPDIIFVITQAVTKGKKEALYVSLGLTTGCMFHATLASFGVAFIFQQSALAFNMLKTLGVIYLLYLAYKTFVNADKEITATDDNKAKLGYFKGILMNILNPKVILFFLAFLPQFVPSNVNHISLYMFMLGVIFMLVTLVVFSIVAILASQLNTHLISKPKMMTKVNKGSAFVLGGLAILLALARQS